MSPLVRHYTATPSHAHGAPSPHHHQTLPSFGSEALHNLAHKRHAVGGCRTLLQNKNNLNLNLNLSHQPTPPPFYPEGSFVRLCNKSGQPRIALYSPVITSPLFASTSNTGGSMLPLYV